MKKYGDVLSKTAIFEQISVNEIESILNCLGQVCQKYKKNEILVLAGSEISLIGIILVGSVQIIKEDILGNRTIISELKEGDMFGEAFAFAGMKQSAVTVIATEACETLSIDYRKMLSPCSSACSFHKKLVENMIKLIAKKNLELTSKMDILSQKTTRDRLLMYLTLQMRKNRSRIFYISFTRDELADYLCVNRSAMSRELSRMRDDGIIRFDKKRFEILNQERNP